MTTDLNKYLALKPQVDADVETVRLEVKAADDQRKLSQAIYDATVTRLNNLIAVQTMLIGLQQKLPN